MIVDCFPFFNEFDLLELRMQELRDIVDMFVVVESKETYGGQPKPLYLMENLSRFGDLVKKIHPVVVPHLAPACLDRTTGRLREAYQRNYLWNVLEDFRDDDVIIFSDCDEIPRKEAVYNALGRIFTDGPHRFKVNSYYYTVNWLVDYGHDWAARPRIGLWRDVRACGSMYDFRMYKKNECPAIENGGWHFGYFGGPQQIQKKVATMTPFLAEYKLFGDQALRSDMLEGRDLHHRRCELPAQFLHRPSGDLTLPKYYLNNRERFRHFTEEYYKEEQ